MLKCYQIPDLKKIRLTGGFLHDFQKIVKEKAMPYQWEVLNDRVEGADKSGSIENFRIAAGESDQEYFGTCFQDSDIGKWLEAAAYHLAMEEDPVLEKNADDVINLLGRAQQKDGYLNTYFTVAEPGNRFTNIRECDELYCFGHLAEAAVAYYESTGKRKFLDIMCRYADLLCKTFGNEEGQIPACDGHPEAEYAFVRLYEATGCKRYLQQAGFQLDTRGSEPYYYDIEWERRGYKSFHPHLQGERPSDDKGYDQSERPVRELKEPVGHAVKVGYLLTGMAAYGRCANDQEMLNACGRVLDSTIQQQMYITGAVGSTTHKEAFSSAYYLPNGTAYGETCASVALIRALVAAMRTSPRSVWADAMERIIYNALPAGISMDGEHYFYVNPLEVYPPEIQADKIYEKVKPVRQPWYPCACCPPNLVRMAASLGKCIYLFDKDRIYVNLYASSEGTLTLDDHSKVHLIQKTEYPWDGMVHLQVEGGSGKTLFLRIPGWCDEGWISVNGKSLGSVFQNDLKKNSGNSTADQEDGYYSIEIIEDRTEITLELKMGVYPVYAHPLIRADAGKAAVMRGPVVYCAEEKDCGKLLYQLSFDPDFGFSVGPETVWHAPVLSARKGFRDKYSENVSKKPYFKQRPEKMEAAIYLVPYAFWGNRNDGLAKEMTVWLRTAESSDKSI